MAANLDMAWAVSICLGVIAACSAGPERDCARDTRSRDWEHALVSCEAALVRTNDPARAIDAATAAYSSHRPIDVLRLAARALDGQTAGDAHGLIGAALHVFQDHGPAAEHLKLAAKLHAAEGKPAFEARDDQQLAGVACELGDYQEALSADEAARAAALRAHDELMVVYVDIALADILREIGDRQGAEAAIEQALAEAREPDVRVWALLKRGELHIDQGHPALAREPLTRALEQERARKSPRTAVLEALHLNLSYVERKARAFSRALEEMEQAREAGTDTMSYRLNRGLVFADMERLPEAVADLAAAEAEKLEGEWSWWVPFQRAQVAGRLGDVAGAIAADRRAIDQVAKLASRSGSFGPTVIANHREPHLHLVGLLAAAQRWSEVLDVVATMDGQSLLDSRELASDLAPSSEVSASQPSRPAAGSLVPGAATLAVEAWRGRRLVIVVPGGGRVWRLDVHDGEVSGSDVGEATGLADLARTLETDPGNVEAGRRLGNAMLLPHLALHARVALLVIGPMARAPLAGLDDGDGPAYAHYQLMRVPGLLPRAVVKRSTTVPVVIGDPGGDLPAAADEARRVARRLRGSALVGAAATRAAFAGAAGAAVMHIAAHTTQGRDGATLDLADGPVTVADVAKLVPAPGLVVLASCGAAEGRDDAGNGSLTNAFLDAGADAVVGTRWSIGDADAARFVEAFYAAGGDHDPVRALGDAQRGSRVPATTRAAFEVVVARPPR